MIASLLLSLTSLMQTSTVDPSLLTVAEKSDYTETATSAQVVDLIDRIKQQSTILRIAELGTTFEGQSIPLIVLANPPLTINDLKDTAASVARGRTKPVCFIMANIHAGEIEGKEACLMLARELALDPDHPLLKDLIIVIAPNYNADGNDKFDDVKKNRPGQDGPTRCGVRPNAQGFDLNRDYIKLEAPETRALVTFLTEVDPDISIDCHTTNGSHHRYVLTYDAPLNPSGHAAPMDFIRNELLPEVTMRMKQSTGYDLWYYGNFNRDRTAWESYSAHPRYGGSYQGLRSQMSVLSEAYSYAPYRDRTIATREFLRHVLTFVAEHKAKVIEINQRARQETIARGVDPQPSDLVGIRHRIAAHNTPAIVKGFERGVGGEGGAVAHRDGSLGPPKDYSVVHLGRFEPTLAVRRPMAYIIPPFHGSGAIIDKLCQHGIEFEEFAGNATCEVYTVTAINRAPREFQKHREVTLDVHATLAQRAIPNGSFIVRTAQPLGTLVVYLLEPQSEDGLATWNYFDDVIEVGREFPIMRVRTTADLKLH